MWQSPFLPRILVPWVLGGWLPDTLLRAVCLTVGIETLRREVYVRRGALFISLLTTSWCSWLTQNLDWSAHWKSNETMYFTRHNMQEHRESGRQVVLLVIHEVILYDDLFNDEDNHRVPLFQHLRVRDFSLARNQWAREVHTVNSQTDTLVNFLWQTRMPEHTFDILLLKSVQRCRVHGYLLKVKEKSFLYLQMVAKGYAFRDQCYIWQRGAGIAISLAKKCWWPSHHWRTNTFANQMCWHVR